MALCLDDVVSLFKHLETGDGAAFYDHVVNDVDWTVEGTHPLAGHYRSESDFQNHTFKVLGKVLPGGVQPHVTHALVAGDWAVVGLESMATARNGLRFDNKYCWVMRFADGKIAEVRELRSIQPWCRRFWTRTQSKQIRQPDLRCWLDRQDGSSCF